VEAYVAEEERIAAEKLEEERLAAQEQEKARIYAEGIKYEGFGSINYLYSACRCYEKIRGYKDANERIERCRRKAEELVEQRKKRTEEEAARLKKRNKRKKLTAAVVVLIIAAGIVAWILLSVFSGAGRAEKIENALNNMTFYGTESRVLEESNGGGAITLATVMTESDITLEFLSDGNTVMVRTTERYDEEPFITKNGERVWDRETTSSEEKYRGDVKISLLGKVTIRIGNETFEVVLGSNDIPHSLKKGNVEYTRS